MNIFSAFDRIEAEKNLVRDQIADITSEIEDLEDKRARCSEQIVELEAVRSNLEERLQIALA